MSETTVTKQPWESMTIWGVVVFALSSLLQRKGYVIDVDTQQASIAWMTAAGQAVGSLLALIGRWRASRPLTMTGKRVSLRSTLLFCFMFTTIGFVGQISLTGCNPIAPGSEAAVVRQEQALDASFVAIDQFLQVEDSVREWAKVNAKPVHAFAETLRRQGPAVFLAYDQAIEAYKASRTPDDKTKIETQAAQIRSWASAARRYLALLRSQTTKR